MRTPAVTIAPATSSATTGSSQLGAGDLHEHEAGEHAERRPGVGAQVRGVALSAGESVARAPCR